MIAASGRSLESSPGIRRGMYDYSFSGPPNIPPNELASIRAAVPPGTSTDVRSPTSTRTEVRSPTSTSTEAYTRGNFTSTVTGGAGAGATTTVNIYAGPPLNNQSVQHQEREPMALPNYFGASPNYFSYGCGYGADPATGLPVPIVPAVPPILTPPAVIPHPAIAPTPIPIPEVTAPHAASVQPGAPVPPGIHTGMQPGMGMLCVPVCYIPFEEIF